MKQRHKIIALITVMLLFVLSCATLITITIAKFVSEENAPWGEDQTIDFTMDNVYEVNNQDELFSALNNGYPFIRLSKDIDNPLIITDDAENLYQDLILDLNGIEIQRNGHDPILNILPGVRLTVTDTSQEQTGGLYNPVGSVFNIAGGTLTVASGDFESGPRYSEYYSYNSYILDNSTNSETKRTLVSGVNDVLYYSEKSSNGQFSGTYETCAAPIIQSYPTTTNEIIYNHGNLYFDTAMTEFANTPLDHAIEADTYCYYYTQDKSSYRSSIPKDADWYYSYYVTTATNEYFKAELTEDEKASDLYTQVSIYGYKGVIEGASQKTQQKDYYAAVKMQEGMGKLDVQKGKFFCYFGVDKTAAVNAMGGIITVKSGEFSSRVPNATSATQNSVNAREDDHLAFTDDNYFNNFKWANDTFADGAQARKGESYCILNGGNAQVTITKGKFYSSNNNTISMSGGELTTSGTFTKNNTVKLDERGDAATKFAAVYMNNGTLNVSDSTFNVYGDYTAGVYIKAGTIDIAKSECNVEGANTNGIYSLVEGEGNFTVTDTNFTMTDGDSQMGIYAENGEVSLRSTSTSTFNIAGANSKAVYAAAGSTIHSTGYQYTLTGEQSEGIYSTGGKVEVVDGSIKLKAASSAGIYSTGGDVNVSNVAFTLDGAHSMGIYSSGGNVSAVNSTTITMNSNVNSYGVHVSNSAAAPTVELSGVTIHAGNSTVNANSGTVDATIGVYLHSNGSGAVKLTNGAHIYSNEVGIAVNKGNVSWTGGGELAAYNGSAIAVKSGNINFGSESDTNSVFTVASKVNGTKDTNGYNSSTTHSYTITIAGAEYNNLHGMYINGGSFTCYGNLYYNFDGLCSDDQTDSSYKPLDNKTRSFAVYVNAAASTLGNTVNFSAVKGRIEVTTGGGVWVAGGSAVLGDNAVLDNTTLAVRTKGEVMYGTLRGGLPSTNNWNYYVTKTGGPALQVTGGSLTVKYGSYIAARGKALFVEDGNVTVTKGNFVGGSLPDVKDKIEQGDTTGKSYLQQRSGLACYYGLFVSGAGQVKIADGNFLGQNGGAFFYGNDPESACVTEIKKGNFLSVYNNSGSVLGLCGVCVMGNATLSLGNVYMNAVNAAISVEGSEKVSEVISIDNAKAKITITGGEYITSTGAVIFNYGDSSSHATWVITGGHFQVGSDEPRKIFQTEWGSYAPVWRDILGAGYNAYYYNGSTYKDVSSDYTSDYSYDNIYVSAKKPA